MISFSVGPQLHLIHGVTGNDITCSKVLVSNIFISQDRQQKDKVKEALERTFCVTEDCSTFLKVQECNWTVMDHDCLLIVLLECHRTWLINLFASGMLMSERIHITSNPGTKSQLL